MIRQQERRSSAVESMESRVLLSQAAHGLALGHYKHDDAATGAEYAESSSGKLKVVQSASRIEPSGDENQDDTPKLKHEKQADVADEHEHGDDDKRSASNGATSKTTSPTDELTDHGTEPRQPPSGDADPSPHSDDGSDPVRHDSSNADGSSNTPTRIPVAAIELPGRVTVVAPVAVPPSASPTPPSTPSRTTDSGTTNAGSSASASHSTTPTTTTSSPPNSSTSFSLSHVPSSTSAGDNAAATTSTRLVATASGALAQVLSRTLLASNRLSGELLEASAAFTTATATPGTVTESSFGQLALAAATSSARRSPFALTAITDGLAPAESIEAQQLAAAMRTVAASAFGEAPVAARIAGEMMSSMLVSPPRFHIAPMGSPLALVGDSLAAFVEESAALPMAMLDGVGDTALPTASLSARTSPRRAWFITAAVAAVDVIALSYLYQQHVAARRQRARQHARVI